jgi:hypothetical protein
MAKFSVDDVVSEITAQAPQFGVDPRIATSLFMAENSGSGRAKSGDGDAVSSANARGVMQVTDSTARGLQKAGFLPPEWKFDPENLSSQVQAGLAAIKEKMKRVRDPSDIFEVAASYNGGTVPHNNYKNGELDKLPAETKDYFRKVTVAANNLGMKVSNPMDTVTSAPVADNSSFAPTGESSAPPTPGTTVGSRTSVRKSVFDEGTLNDFTRSINSAGQTYEQSAQAIIDGGKLRQTALQGMQAAISQQSQAAGKEAALDAAIVATDRARRVNILSSQNLNPDATDNLLVKTGQVIDETDTQLRALKPEIDERMAVGMFDNPFQWLVNQTILPGLVAKYNGIATTQNAAIDLFKNKQAATKSQLDISTNMDADLYLQKGVQTQAKIAAKASEDLNRAQLEASAATARDAMWMAALATDSVAVKDKALQKTKETQTDTDTTNERVTTEQAKQEALAGVNNIQKQIGGNQYKNWIQFASEPQAKREELLAAARSGKYGDSLGNSVSLIKSHGNMQNIAVNGGAAIQAWVRNSQGEAQQLADADVAELRKTNPGAYNKLMANEKEQTELMKGKLNTIQQKYQMQAATDMSHASVGNPFAIQYSVIAKDPSLANNPLAININTYGPSGTDPRISKVTEPYIMDRFAYSVVSGSMPLPDAVKAITEFYKVGSRLQQAATKPQLFGLETPEKTYAVNLEANTGIKKPIDLGNPVDVESALTRLVAKRAGGLAIGNPMGDTVNIGQ